MPTSTKGGFGSLQSTESDAATSASDLFQPELIEASVVSRHGYIIRPNSLTNVGPMHIHIPAEGVQYMDPASLRINADIRIKKKNATTGAWDNLVEADSSKVAPYNNLGNNLFRSIELFMDQKQITVVTTPSYPLKCYIETLLSYGKDAEDGHLRCSYWKKDKAGKHDIPAENDAFAERHKYIEKSRKVRICEPLKVELAAFDKVMATGLTFDLSFNLNHAGNILQRTGTDEYQIQYDDFYLTFDRVVLAPSIHASIERTLSSGKTISYNYVKGLLRTKQVPLGESNVIWQNLSHSTLPETIAICMVDSLAFNGAYDKNPYNFQHFNLKEIVLRVNSRSIPIQPIQCDFSNKEAIRAYRHFMDNIGIKNSNSPTLVSYEDFLEGSTMFVFDLTPDMCANYHSHKRETGVIELDIQFHSALTKGMTIYALCNYTDHVFISGGPNNRQVNIDQNLMLG